MKKLNKLKKYRRKLSQKDYRTFNEWKALFRHVNKGEKCSRDKNGRAVFHINQTSPQYKKILFETDGKGNHLSDNHPKYFQDDDGSFEGFDNGHFY